MRRKLLFIALAILIAASSLSIDFISEQALANSELREQISEVEKERQETAEEAEKTEEELQQLEEEMQELNSEIERIDHEAAETNQQIREKRAEIEDVQEEIERLQEEIEILEERIAERDELLRDRARTMYQSGGSVNYLDVVLGSQSFSDFLSRVNALSMIAQQDRNILDAHIADHEQLEEAKTEVEEQLMILESHLEELENLMARLEEQREEKDQVMTQLQQKEDELHTDLGELENAEEILKAQEAALKKELEAYEERKRQEEEERKRQEEAEAAASSNTSSSQPSRSNQTHAAPEVTDSGFMRPATGRITSSYGYRSFNGGSFHHGIDIGKNGRTGDVPIVAVADGTVVDSYYSNSYGNVILIAHVVNGDLVTTLYAHLENREVSKGQSVNKGQQLGLMGNTGHSFGAHLHFEVHEGGWNGAKSNSVDPMRYIPN
ncbi:murein hydrolase activator EnvC [Halalkalibacter sp. AB-rgal2]|uniref:murein hydrolase activator EnvC family protein n=1 Tax=Halalkalibacter sp. AB-rgal2 TaxID=3242695 RepID=UPI00359CBCE6